jgi:hypothetical protein
MLSDMNLCKFYIHPFFFLKGNIEICWVRWMFMKMLHLSILLFENQYWNILSEMNVYVNVTFIHSSFWKAILKDFEWDECLCKFYILPFFFLKGNIEICCWVRWMFMKMLHSFFFLKSNIEIFWVIWMFM